MQLQYVLLHQEYTIFAYLLRIHRIRQVAPVCTVM